MLLIDIIIPVLNEEKILTEKREYYRSLQDKVNIIFVDGGSTDRTVALARELGHVVGSSAGRGIQKNHGAKESRADRLLFLHVDTFIEEQVLERMERVLDDGAVGGCLTMRVEDEWFLFRVYEQAVNMRARVFGVIDGDLGLFVRRDVFDRLGGFDDLAVMEDLLFGRKLRKIGAVRVLPQTIRVSSRKWHEQGFFKTFMDYALAYGRLWAGTLGIKMRSS